VPYKRIDLIVEAFSHMPDKKLIVIGDGPEMKKIKSRATKNIEILGYQSDQIMQDYMQKAKAFVFAAEEDFGITPVEAQACGTPVIAFGKGGALETIVSLNNQKPTGVFFKEQKLKDIIDAVNIFEANEQVFDYNICRDNALRFSVQRFNEEIESYITKKHLDFVSKKKYNF
ncbi:TPA: glycosyltransferase, partial [Klebsiella pneumoniae]|nr:glycosyltransferase [Klebsiella pneumoniae]